MLSLQGCGDDSPVINSKTIDDVGQFIDKSPDINQSQRVQLASAVMNLQSEYVVKHGMSKSLRKDLGDYFDGMHVNEVIKKGGIEQDKSIMAKAHAIADKYFSAGNTVD